MGSQRLCMLACFLLLCVCKISCQDDSTDSGNAPTNDTSNGTTTGTNTGTDAGTSNGTTVSTNTGTTDSTNTVATAGTIIGISDSPGNATKPTSGMEENDSTTTTATSAAQVNASASASLDSASGSTSLVANTTSAGQALTSTLSSASVDPTNTSVITSENTTTKSQLTTDVTTHTPTMTAAATTTETSDPTVCGVNATIFDEDSVCSPANHTVYLPSPIPAKGQCDNANPLPVNSWFRLEGSSDCEVFTYMPITNGFQQCYKSGAYGVKYPYYLAPRDAAGDLPSPGGEASLSFCATEYTDAERNLCCHYVVDISVFNCGPFSVYKLTEALPAAICGHYFTSPAGTAADQRYYDARQVVFHEQVVKKEESLPDSLKQEVVTVIFKVDDWQQFKQLASLEEDFSYQLITELQNYYNSTKEGQKMRRRRNEALDVLVLYGSPTYDTVDNVALYKLVVVDAESKPISGDDVNTVLSGVKMTNLPPGVASLVAPQSVTTIPPTLLSERRDNLWIAIVIIVGVVAFIVILVLLILCCCILCRRKRSGRMDVSDHKVALVEEPTKPIQGVDNMAMEGETDRNQNGKAVVKASSELTTAEQAV